MSKHLPMTMKFIFFAMFLFSINANADHEVSIDEFVECGQKVEWGKNCGISVKCSGDATGAAQLTYPDVVARWGSAGISWAFDDGSRWIPDSPDDPGCLGWQEGEPFPTRTGPDYADQIPPLGEPGHDASWDQCTYVRNDNAQTMCLNSDTLINLPANPIFSAKCEGPGNGKNQSVARVDVAFSGCGFEWRPNVHDPGCYEGTGWAVGDPFPPRTGSMVGSQIPAPGEPGYVPGWIACSYVYFYSLNP